MKTQELIYAARVKQIPDPKGNGKCVRARKAMDSYGSEARTQGSDTIYLYLANTGEVGHGSEVREVWSGGGEKGEPIFGFPLKFYWEKCSVGMASHPKEVNMSWSH